MQNVHVEIKPGFETDHVQESGSHLLQLGRIHSENVSRRGAVCATASTANYQQSRGLIKVWLSSECSWGYAESGIERVPPKITRCLSEAGAVKLDCWPLSTFDPLPQSITGLGESSSREGGNPAEGKGETARLCVDYGQGKWISLPPEGLLY